MRRLKVALIILFAFSSGCETKDEKANVAVVGVGESANLFEDRELKKEKADLGLGGILAVLASEADVLQVRTELGKEGWLRRCWVCSLSELERRKAQDQVPKQVICVGSDGNGTYMYGGSISIGGANNRFATKFGDAVWLDSTMKGKAFSLGSTSVTGDPSLLLLNSKKGEVVKLPIWTSKDIR